MSLKDLMRTPVQTIESSATVAEAAKQMMKHGVGALVVTSPGDPTPVTMITDRDLVKLVAIDKDPQKTPISEATPEGASPRLVSATVDDDLMSIAKRMHMAGVRRVPLLEGGKLVGIVSLDDIVVLLSNEMRHVSQELAELSAAVKTEFVHEHVLTSRIGALWRSQR